MTDRPKVVFMGTPEFAVPSLEKLVASSQCEVILVVTQPDRPVGRKRVLTPPPVKVAAERLGIPVFQPEKLRESEAVQEIINKKPDLVVTAAYGQILPKNLLDYPRFGCINVHASLLPKYRGGAPIHYAIINGEKETGITIMYMTPELDAGDILAQRSLPILETDHVGILHDKLSQLGAELLYETLPAIFSGKVNPVPQDDSEATYAPNIRREDEWIDWSKSAHEIVNQVRGMHPWPVAVTTWNGAPLKVWWAEKVDLSTTEEPGTVVKVDDEGIYLATGKGVVAIRELQPAGKKRMTVDAFLRGRKIIPGERMGR